jgi:signal transduction histidine kinase
VVLLAALLSVTNALVQVPLFRAPFDAVAFCLLLTGAAALWFRRRAPDVVAWFVAVLTAMLVLAVWVWPGIEPGVVSGQRLDPDGILLPAAVPFAAYTVPVHAHRHYLGWLPLAVTAAVAVAGAPPQTHLITVTGQVITLIGAPAVLGLYVAARAARLEREQQLRAEQARRAERLRLAAEIHDVVSHRVSVMVLQAGALQLTAADEPTRQAADELRVTGCHALDELRDLVGLLNTAGSTGADALAPLGPIPDLSELLASAESVGIAVDLHEEGEPHPLPAAVGRTVHRVAQEALTNVVKHAPGSRVRLEVHHLPDAVRVRVRNTAPVRDGDTALAAAGGGTGLLGLRRRIELINGTLVAEPCADGGFLVDASLPALVPTGQHP